MIAHHLILMIAHHLILMIAHHLILMIAHHLILMIAHYLILVVGLVPYPRCLPAYGVPGPQSQSHGPLAALTDPLRQRRMHAVYGMDWVAATDI